MRKKKGGKEEAKPQIQIAPFASQGALQYIPKTAHYSVCKKDT